MSPSYRQLELLSQQLHQAHRSAIHAGLSARGLEEVGHPILLTILQSSDQDFAQRDLAELLHISPPAVANSLKSLEKGGYIHREPFQGDARRNRVALTDKGRQAVEGCHAVFDAVSRQMLEGFSPQERAQLLTFRQRMLANLRGSAAPTSEKEES